MNFKFSSDLETILRPMQLVLKEGQNIKENPLDYQLMMLHLHHYETLRSPKQKATAKQVMRHSLKRKEENSKSL